MFIYQSEGLYNQITDQYVLDTVNFISDYFRLEVYK